jgi:hypothetical protein
VVSPAFFRARFLLHSQVVTGIKTPLPGDTICGVDLQNLQLIVPSSQNLIRILIQKEFDLVGLKLSPAMEVDSLATVFAMKYFIRYALHCGRCARSGAGGCAENGVLGHQETFVRQLRSS